MGCIHAKCCGKYPKSSDDDNRDHQDLGPYTSHGTHILANRTLDFVLVPAHNFRLEYSVLSQRGYYPESPDKENQDSFCIKTQIQGNPNVHFFGVFDGHGQFGTQCSDFVKSRLVEILSDDHTLLDDPVKAYNSAFLATNEELHNSRDVDDSMSGTTAITVLAIGDALYVANVGDSRAVIAFKDGDQLRAEDLSCIVGILVVTMSCWIKAARASIHEYNREPFIPRFNSFFVHGGSEGLYASQELDSSKHTSSQPDKPPPLNGKSFIRFESITFTRTTEATNKQNDMQQKTGLVEAIIVEVKDRYKVGGSYLNSDAICCTPALAKDGACNVGEVIIRQDPDKPGWPRRIQTFFDGKNEEAKMVPQTVEINSTGMYYLYFMFCDPELQVTLISGRTVWRNPEGYLPGKMAPLMTFYGFMSLVYPVLGLIWFLHFVQYWKDIIQLHYHITAVIGLGMCEMALWYFEYANFNATGSRPMGITMWAVTFSAIKKTVSRLLLLVVSMGYGVVRPTLGGITAKVLLLGVIYFVASEALELVEHLGNINDFSGKTRLFLVLPVAILDACFIVWIFSSLSKTLEKLQIRRSMAKLELYRKFTNALAVSVLLSVAWIGYELYFNATDPLSELWQRAWIIPAFWTVLAFQLLLVICILWAPSHNPTRYAYSEETIDDLDEEGISLTGSAIMVAGDLATKLERKERKLSIAADPVFGLGEDLEEDKRE